MSIAMTCLGPAAAATYSGAFVATFTDGIDLNHLLTDSPTPFLASGGDHALDPLSIDGGPIILNGAFSFNTNFLTSSSPYTEVLPYNMQIQLGRFTLNALEGSITLGGGPDNFYLSESDATLAPIDPLDPLAGFSGYTSSISLNLSNGSTFLNGQGPGQVIPFSAGVTGVGTLNYISVPAFVPTFGDFNISDVTLLQTSVPDVPTWASMLVGVFAVGGAMRLRRARPAGHSRGDLAFDRQLIT